MTYHIWSFVVLAVLISRNLATAGLLAYEGFDYPGGTTLAGASGGVGWSNGWVDVSANLGAAAISGNLIVTSNAPVGFDARSSGNALLVNNSSRCGRWLDCSPAGLFAQAALLNASGNVGADGKTVYVSFLQQPDSSSRFYEFEFHRDNLGDPGRIAGIGNDVANSTQINLRAPSGTPTPLGTGNTNVNFYVVRIDFKPGNDDVYVYRNPVNNIERDNDPVLIMLAVADMSFDGLSIGAYLNSVTVKTDEIRIGQTWASVLGDPPTFVLQPTNQTLYAGQTVHLDALAESALPLSYQWYRIAGDLTNSLVNETNASLPLTNVEAADAGKYFVTASNLLGIATSEMADVKIEPIITAINGPLFLPIQTNDSLTINTTVSGSEPLVMQWYKDGQPIPGANSTTFSIPDASRFDAGQYALVASNVYGSVTSSVVSVYLNTGGLLAYEGFDEPPANGDIGGANGGFGWAGSWQNLNGASSLSLSNSLIAAASAPVAFDARSSGGSLFLASNSRKGRFLDCSSTGNFFRRGYVNSNGDIGADGRTLFLSFLQQADGNSLFYEFELHRDDLGDGGRMGGIGNDTANADKNLRIETPPGGSSTFWSLGPGDTNVNFYVLRIDFKAGNDDIFVYRNPTSVSEPLVPTLVVSNFADLSFDGISLAAYLNNRTVSHDEIRLGMTWADVTGGLIPSELRLNSRTNRTSHLLLAGAPNYTYALQGAATVSGPWTNLGAVSVSGLGVGQFVDTNQSDQRFYRATNSSVWFAPTNPDLVIAGFEQPTYAPWVPTGTAFGAGPAQGTLPGQQPVSGYQGSRLVNTFNGGDDSIGTLTSPPFIISKPFINFLIGGGNLPGQECMNLLVSNAIVRTATGANSETLTAQQWDVSAYVGQTAMLQIVDSATGSWGHVNVDQIVFSDIAFPALSRTMLLTDRLLNLPVKNGAPMRRVTVNVAGNPVRDFDIALADAVPDWWAFVDVSPFSNQMATVSVNALALGSTGLSSIVQTNGLIGATNLYRETLRPQFHFSSQRGWLNDANAMFYDHGQYHLYYQHDPFNWDGAGQKWWGHAVSPDMVNWHEIQEGIYSHSYGDDVWSGSAVVDSANTSGFKTGTNDVIVAAFTSTGRGECIAYSNDGGSTFIDYPNNPVVIHDGRDPHLLWYAPSNYWVMALYDATGGNGISFYTSPNLRQWTYRSKINGYFECPDLFPLPVDGDTNNSMWLLCDASSGYQLGQFNGASFVPVTAKLPGNRGAGFYASQTFANLPPGDPRKVRIGWAQISLPGMPFNQFMYFPTELSLRTTSSGVRLCSEPIREIQNLHATEYAWTNLNLVAGTNPLSGIRGTLFDVNAQFTIGTAQEIRFTFQGATVIYSGATQQISCNGVVNSLPPIDGVVQLQILVDRDSIEIFGNHGQLYMPVPANNSAGSALISLSSTGGTANFQSLMVAKLKTAWSLQ